MPEEGGSSVVLKSRFLTTVTKKKKKRFDSSNQLAQNIHREAFVRNINLCQLAETSLFFSLDQAVLHTHIHTYVQIQNE